MEELSQVWGIGAKIAEKMYDGGIKTIEDLKEEVEKNPDLLTGY